MMYMSRVTVPGGGDAASGSLAALLRATSGRASDSHRLIWSLFPAHAEAERDFLYRVDDTPDGKQILLASSRRPVNDHGIFRIETKEYDPPISEGDVLRISLRANPAVNRVDENGKKRRTDVVKEHVDGARSRGEETDWETAARVAGLDWLACKGRRYGFRIVDVAASGYTRIRKDDGGKRRGLMGVVDFDGLVEVTNPSDFRDGLFNGVGRGKGFGMGLLLAKPV